MEFDTGSAPLSPSALERARLVSQALSEAARRARFSSRSRRAYTGGGFQARRGQKAFRIGVIVSFWVLVAVPSAVAAIYYAFIASDQYVAEAQFTVQGGDVPIVDTIGKITGLPGIAVVQDTQIVANYIQSRAAVEQLDNDVALRSLYGTANADSWARFDPKKPIEKFVKYWEGMSDVSIKMPSGIVVLKVRAFNPTDASRIAAAVLHVCEQLINQMNDRMHRDAVASADDEVERTSMRLKNAQIALEQARNDQGMLDAGQAGAALDKLITEARTAQMQLSQEYSSQLRAVSANAPQMKALKARLDATDQQIAELEAKVTSSRLSAADAPTVSASMTKFAELDLEDQIAQRLYSSAVASLELARLTAEHKMMYLNTFVQPVLPEEPLYPRRALYSVLVLVSCLAIWGALVGLVSLVRNHMA